jgi:hypothetical protein
MSDTIDPQLVRQTGPYKSLKMDGAWAANPRTCTV